MYVIPSELVDEFSRGNGSLFVGAGLSMGAGLPGWTTLVEPLADELEGIPEGTALTKVAQFYENTFGRRRLVERLRIALDSYRVAPTEAHLALAMLPVRRIFTTNFDGLIEAALAAQGLSCTKVVNTEELSLLDASRMQLIKLHGDLDQPRSVVITADDYNRYLDDRPAIAELIKIELQTRTVLFIGYSFNDIDLDMLLSRVGRQGLELRRNLFTVQLNPTEIIIHELDRQGIKVIPLQFDPHIGDATKAVSGFLSEFSRRLRQSRTPPPPGVIAQPTNHNLPERDGELLGRDREFAQVMAGLKSQYPLIAIQGFAGIGKTRLALEVGYACISNAETLTPGSVIFQWVVWITAKDKPDQKCWLNDVLDKIAQTTGFTAITQSGDSKKKKAQVELLLKTYRILLIIDNYETIDDPELTQWIQDIPMPSKVIVTTRNNQLQQMARAVTLMGLETTEALTLLRQFAAQRGLDNLNKQSDASLVGLVQVTGGNPQAIKLGLGLISGGTVGLNQVINQLYTANPDKRLDVVFEELFTWSWNLLPDDAQKILLTTPLFVGVSSIREDALKGVSNLDDFFFEEGLKRCIEFGLLEEEKSAPRSTAFRVTEEKQSTKRYIIHSMTRAFARRQLNATPELEGPARGRCSDYFLKFVRTHVRRLEPKPRYWNALVTDGMLDIDPEWPSIQEVIKWTDQQGMDEQLVEFVMWLVHYMDSRFLNRERLSYVGKAIEACQRMKRVADEALLRIDALGWTYVEEGRLAEAYEEILRGFELTERIEGQEREDLSALGYAWRARVRIEQDNVEEAKKLIAEALTINCEPWIKTRVNMAAGDIALKQAHSEDALLYYQRSADEAKRYGDEGHGYQTAPRIGLAYLGTGNLDEAERQFRALREYKQIAIGKLYAEYGLAMVAYKRGETISALGLINDIQVELSRRTTSNLLLKLINKLFDDLKRDQP